MFVSAKDGTMIDRTLIAIDTVNYYVAKQKPKSELDVPVVDVLPRSEWDYVKGTIANH